MWGRIYKSGVALAFICLGSYASLAQTLAQHNWYFGNSNSGLRFNRGNNSASVVTNQATPFGTAGGAVATDPTTGNLLFYTDGDRVYDACHLLMPNSGLLGNTGGNQPAAITPVPGQPNKYFVFTNSANFTAGGTIRWSVVDLALFGNAIFPAPALGQVENPKNNVIATLPNRAEGMIVIPHANGTDFWLITQQVNSQTYSVTLINAASYPAGTFATTNFSGIAFPTTVANFSYSARANRMAVSPQDASTDAFIMNFNSATGGLTFDSFILNTGIPSTTNQAIYDIEWNNSGNFLYLSRHGEAGIAPQVFQYDYLNPTTTLAPLVAGPLFRSYGLQIAPDSSIYHLYQATNGGPFLLGRFSNIDTVAAAVTYTALPLGNTNFNATQFPSFIPRSNINFILSFTTRGICQNSPTSFFPDVQPAADSLQWEFEPGFDTTAWSPVYTYETAGTFNVTMRAFFQGQTQSVTQPVTINPFPLTLQLVQDTTACRSEFPPPRGSSSPTQFSVTLEVQGGTPTSVVWSNGDTGLTLTPDSAGYYYVVATDAGGCSGYAGVNVKEYDLADQRANVWYFGNRAGIDFNEQPPVALNVSAMNAPEGCSIICDRNGEVIFYTDGDQVFDQTNAVIDTGIGGDPQSAQSALIVPVPGDETLYYIFTTKAINGTGPYELRYSLFDLKQNSGLGAVVEKDILLFAQSTERIAANGRWLIAHEYGNNYFRAYPISGQGIGSPVVSEIGSVHSFKTLANGEGYMKLGPRGNLAVALSEPNVSNVVELFTLVDSSGVISNYRQINLNLRGGQPGQVYGVEFSPGGNKVFATVKGPPSRVFEYFLDSLDRPFFRNSIVNAGELGALQIAPDGQIYIAINGSGVLGTIQADEDTTRVSTINFSGFTLAGGTNSRLGLPSFVQQVGNAFGGPGFEFAGQCLGEPTNFFGTPTDAIDEFLWFFGDGASDNVPNPVHTYATANTFSVSMRLTNRCGLDTTLTRPVQIFSPPPRPTVPSAIALCTGAVTLDANTGNLPDLTYSWSTGETTRTIVVSRQMMVTITNTDVNGCFNSAQSIVVENRPQLDLGPDLTICEDNATPALNALNPGATYQWRINGANASNAQTQAVDVTVPGTFTYEVTVTDPVTTCFLVETKVYDIKVSPAFVLSGTNPTTCNATDGTISLALNASAPPGGPLYSYFLSGPGGFNQQGIDQAVPSVANFTNREAGTYSVIVTDQISGCTLSNSVGLTDAPFAISASSLGPNCDPVALRVVATGGALNFQYRITNNGTGAVQGPFTATTTTFDTSPILPAGNYTVEVTDNNSCIATTATTVTPNPVVPVTFTNNLCVSPATITAAGGTGYTWTGRGISGGANSATVQINPGIGQFTYQVVATGPGLCPATVTTTVDLIGTLAPDFTQTTECASQVQLNATPTGAFTYRWYRNGVLQGGLGGSSVSLGLSEDGVPYAVEVVSTVNGCVVRSANKNVSVVGPVDATLTASLACDDNQPFTLTSGTTATGVTYAWFRNNTTIAGANTPTIQQNQAGTYRVDISRSTCTASAFILVSKAPLPVGLLRDRVIICNDPDNTDLATSQVDLDPGAFVSFNWFKNQVPLGVTTQVYTATSEGLYEVDITNIFGCVSRDKTDVRNDCVPVLNAPTAFRPSSSAAENQAFKIFSFFVTDNFQIFIYNRWGELVYQSNDRNFTWNGGYNNNLNQPLPVGTYTYVIKYVSVYRPQQGIQEKRGGVLLLR
ncbi:MAG: gliding motility-associated C-terminal domain-containing protein [Cyclobacteriaceae bacterium]